jgi:hypothetical protein
MFRKSALNCDSRRMQLQAALTLAEELGDTVLRDSADT